MKNLYIIGGTMGVGKTTVCRSLQKKLDDCVFLDGDWCWDSHPFAVTAETKQMVVRNIRFLLNQFLSCTAYKNVVFCWVMHEREIIDSVTEGIEPGSCDIKEISLVCSPAALRERLEGDVRAGRRTADVIGRSLARIPLYERLGTLKIETDGRSPDSIAEEIAAL